MGQKIVQVDAFTDRAFGGNPAAVCVLEGPRGEGWMQRVAGEMNLSETSFLYPEGDGVFRLRWFTPTVEVDLCGHATLAASHALWTEGHLKGEEPARFETRSGRLTATRREGWITLDFPATPAGERSPDGSVSTEALAAAVGGTVRGVGFSRFDGLVELASEEAVRACRPDLGRIAGMALRGVIVTARASLEGFDFVSRFFAPGVGVDEDPVCGSAHCCLGPYWAERLGKDELDAYQASARGGVLRVGVEGDRVTIAGRAVTVLRGELTGGAGDGD